MTDTNDTNDTNFNPDDFYKNVPIFDPDRHYEEVDKQEEEQLLPGTAGVSGLTYEPETEKEPKKEQYGINYKREMKDWGLRLEWGLLDNDKEREKFMQEKFGGRWMQDKFGNYVIEQLSDVEEGNELTTFDQPSFTRYDLADWSDDYLPVGASVAVGIGTAGLGFFPSVLSVAAAGGGFKFWQEAGEEVFGKNLQGADEVEKMMIKEAMYAGTGEALYRSILRPLGRYVLGPGSKKMAYKVDDPDWPVQWRKGLISAREKALNLSKKLGFRPKAGEVSGAFLTRRMGRMLEMVFGDPKLPLNSNAMKNNIESLLNKTGTGTQTTFKQSGKFKTETSKLELGGTIKSDIEVAKKSFRTEADIRYTHLHGMTGDHKWLPTRYMKRTVKKLMDDMIVVDSKLVKKPVFNSKKIEGGMGYEMVTVKGRTLFKRHEAALQEMQDILATGKYLNTKQYSKLKNLLWEMSEQSGEGMSRGQIKQIYKGLRQSENDILGIAKSGLPNFERVMPYLKETTKWYSKNIDNFSPKYIDKLLLKPEYGGYVAPEDVVKQFFKTKGVTKLTSVMKVLPEETKSAVRRYGMEKILKSIYQRPKDVFKGEPEYFGQSLMKELDNYGDDTLHAMFGKKLTKDLKEFAKASELVTTRLEGSGGIVAASIALHPLKNIGKLARMNVLQNLMLSDTGLHWLTTGIRNRGLRAGADATSRLGIMVAMLVEDEVDSGFSIRNKDESFLEDVPEEFDEYLMDEDELEEFKRKRQSSTMNAPRNTNVASRPNNQGGARVVLPPMGMNTPYQTS